jgi:HD-GYP domain-containing protein (c-di-GMP phosphodiesterase class II)
MQFNQENCIYNSRNNSSLDEPNYNFDSNYYKILSNNLNKTQFFVEVYTLHQAQSQTNENLIEEQTTKQIVDDFNQYQSKVTIPPKSDNTNYKTFNSSIISSNKEESIITKSRKWGRDSFHKKIKCMFLKYVICFFQTKLDLTFVQKLSQKLVTNVTKKYNRDLLNSDLETFGIIHLGLTSSHFINKNTGIDFKFTTVARLYQEYLNSVNFEMDFGRIKEKENELYVETLKSYINDFVRYYCQTKSTKN